MLWIENPLFTQWVGKPPFRKLNEWRAPTFFFTPFSGLIHPWLQPFKCTRRGQFAPNLLWSLEREYFQISPCNKCLSPAWASTPVQKSSSIYLWELRCLLPITFPSYLWNPCFVSLIAGLQALAAGCPGRGINPLLPGTSRAPRVPCGLSATLFPGSGQHKLFWTESILHKTTIM